MKKYCFLCFALFFGLHLNAQINGNGKITTQVRTMKTIDKVFVNINAQVNIIASDENPRIELTADENIVDYIATDKKGGYIVLDQKEWVEGSQQAIINIYTPELKQLKNDSWSEVRVSDLNQERFIVHSSISDITLSGQVSQLEIVSKDSHIFAYDLKAQEVSVKIKEAGRVYVNASQRLRADRGEEGRIVYTGTPELSGQAFAQSEDPGEAPVNTRYIHVSFKNVGLSTIQAYVKGPKPNGRYFSYGLPFRPHMTRKEHWTIGTKLYQVNKLGMKKLLHEVTAADEGQTIKIKKQ
ncbi:MAG: DUF2807 domain-containing protein [Bacteroidota bacterium]